MPWVLGLHDRDAPEVHPRRGDRQAAILRRVPVLRRSERAQVLAHDEEPISAAAVRVVRSGREAPSGVRVRPRREPARSQRLRGAHRQVGPRPRRAVRVRRAEGDAR